MDRLGAVPAQCRISSRFVSRRTVSWRGSWSDHRRGGGEELREERNFSWMQDA